MVISALIGIAALGLLAYIAWRLRKRTTAVASETEQPEYAVSPLTEFKQYFQD